MKTIVILKFISVLVIHPGTTLLTNKRCKGDSEYGNNCGRGNYCNPTFNYCEPCSKICQWKNTVYTDCQKYCPAQYEKMMKKQKYDGLTTEGSIVAVTSVISDISYPDSLDTRQQIYDTDQQVDKPLWTTVTVVACVASLLLTGAILFIFYKLYSENNRRCYKSNITDSCKLGNGHKHTNSSLCGSKYIDVKENDTTTVTISEPTILIKGEVTMAPSLSPNIPAGVQSACTSHSGVHVAHSGHSSWNSRNLALNHGNQSDTCNYSNISDCCAPRSCNQQRDVTNINVTTIAKSHVTTNSNSVEGNPSDKHTDIDENIIPEKQSDKCVITEPKFNADTGGNVTTETTNTEGKNGIQANGIQLSHDEDDRSGEGDSLKFDIEEMYTSYVKVEQPLPSRPHFTETSLLELTKNRKGDTAGHNPVLEVICTKSGDHQVANEAMQQVNVIEYSGYDSEAENETLLKEQPPTTIDCSSPDNHVVQADMDTPQSNQQQPDYHVVQADMDTPQTNQQQPDNPVVEADNCALTVKNQPNVNRVSPVNRVKPMSVVTPQQPVQETQPLVDRTVQTQRQRRPPHPNKRIYDLLKAIDWVEGYYSEGRSIEVYCDLTYISPDVAMQELEVRTGESREKFHLLQSDQHLC